MPPAIADAPQLFPGLDLYMHAFLDLHNDRNVGMAMGGIPWTAIKLWCDTHRISDEDQFDTVVYHIKALDAAYLDYVAKKQPSAQGSKKRVRSK